MHRAASDSSVPQRWRLGDIVRDLGGTLIGSPDLLIGRIGPLATADAGTLSFLAHAKYQSQLQSSGAACVIVTPALQDVAAARGAAWVVPDPYLQFARLTQWWAKRTRPPVPAGQHPTAVVDPSAQLGADVSIGPFAVIEAGACLGDRVVIGAHSWVGRGASLGDDCRLAPRVTFGDGCRMGARGLIHSGAVIGADGFGFAPTQGRWEKIEQLGAVRIGDDVEIGANTTIDRGALDDTVIGHGVKLDNQIQIAHNVRIGDHTAMAGCVGVAGSAVIGAHCTVGGSGMILGHLEIVDHVHITAATLVTRSIRQPGQYSGSFPFEEKSSWEKNAATLRQLHALRGRIQTLEKKIG